MRLQWAIAMREMDKIGVFSLAGGVNRFTFSNVGPVANSLEPLPSPHAPGFDLVSYFNNLPSPQP